MTALNQDVGGAGDPFVAGDSKTLRIAVRDAEGAEFDLSTASSIRWGLALHKGLAPLLEKTLLGGITVTAGTESPTVQSVVNVALDEVDTELLGHGTYHHECEVVRDGITMTVMQGTVTISQPVLQEVGSP